MAFNYPFLPPTQLLMTSHLQPQGLEGSCRHHLPKQPKASPCRDVPSASSTPQHPAATRAAGPHAGALGRPQHVAGKDLTSAAGESFPPPQTSSSPGSSGAFSIPGAFSGRDVRGANPRGIQQGLAKGGPRPRWVLGTLPPTSHFLPSSAQPQLKEFSRAGTPARQSPAGTEPGQGEIPRDGDTAGASVLQERGHVAQVIRRSMQPRRQPRNTRINLLGQNRL